MSMTEAVVNEVSGYRLWADLQEVAQFGARPDGGVGRLALDDNDVKARRWLVDRARELGCTPRVDPVGNIFLRREGTEPSLPAVSTGSHIDSQPAGGAYDGIYGVLGGLAVLRALQKVNATHRRSIEVIAWTNEEGVRFAPGTTGSSAFVGERSLEETRRIVGTDGVTFGEAADICVKRLQDAGVALCDLGGAMHAFVELHIEQGPILEMASADVGVVTGIQGVRWYKITVRGMANHAGTTPRRARKDALEGAVELANALRVLAKDDEDITRFTIGRFHLSPDSINTIPDTATFTVDLRHPDEKVLDKLEQEFRRLTAKEWAGCSAAIEVLSKIPSVTFPSSITGVIEKSAQDLALNAPRLVSGAFHDSMFLARHCATGMIFIPCAGGLSHHPAESITPRHAVSGARLVAATLLRLATSAQAGNS